MDRAGPKTAPPVGTVTFLFTDIEGSTHLWEQHSDAMRAALVRHDDILRSAIEAHAGYVFKTVGDAFCAAFGTAIDALSAAIATHRVLQAGDWGELGSLKIRIGLHTGAAQERDGDYFGQTLNRVARLMSAGHGCQTLLSMPTYELVRDALPLGASLIDLGEHRLKDLIRPEHIYQVVVPDLPSEFPPLKTLDYRPNNLPAQPTALIGREKEITDLQKLLGKDDVRLVTLTGPGGIGKTRLALHLAADTLDDFGDGVWFVNLAPLTDANLVISAVAQVLAVKEVVGQPLIDTLKWYLKEKHMLLILDNFEQVISAATQISELLAACPRLKIVVTSRIALRLRGEREYSVPSLRLPDPKQLASLELITQYEAVRLFIERAQGVKANFEVNNRNAPDVAEICVRLDGLPLAIELAAARVRLFPPSALLSRLSSRLNVLTGGARDLPTRQQTIRNTIEWSYDLLSEGEKQFFRRMAVFQGGSTVEGLEVVCNFDGELQLDVVEGVESLVSKSLLQQREGYDGEPRFWMLETIHEYAREKLEESAEYVVLSREHALYFMGLAEEAEPHLMAARQVEWLQRLEDEHDNLRAALRWARENNEAVIGLRLAGAAGDFWNIHGYLSEGRSQLMDLLSLKSTDGGGAHTTSRSAMAARAKALYQAGMFAHNQGDYESSGILNEQSLAISRELGDKYGSARALGQLGRAAQSRGEHESAGAMFGERLALYEELGDKHGIARALGQIGIEAFMQGDYAGARAFYERANAIMEEQNDAWWSSIITWNLGAAAHREGDDESAVAWFGRSLALCRQIGDKRGIACAVLAFGGVAGTSGRPERGARLLGAGVALYDTLGARLEPEDQLQYEWYLSIIRNQLDEEVFARVWAEGSRMSMEEAIAYALEDGLDE